MRAGGQCGRWRSSRRGRGHLLTLHPHPAPPLPEAGPPWDPREPPSEAEWALANGQAGRGQGPESPAPRIQQVPPKPRSHDPKEHKRLSNTEGMECEKEGYCKMSGLSQEAGREVDFPFVN